MRLLDRVEAGVLKGVVIGTHRDISGYIEITRGNLETFL